MGIFSVVSQIFFLQLPFAEEFFWLDPVFFFLGLLCTIISRLLQLVFTCCLTSHSPTLDLPKYNGFPSLPLTNKIFHDAVFIRG